MSHLGSSMRMVKYQNAHRLWRGVSCGARRGVGHNDHNDHPELRPPLRRGELYPATVIKSRAVARKSAEKCKKKVPKIKERLFSAFLCGHYSGISGLVSTKTMPDLNVPLDSAGIGPQHESMGTYRGSQSNENFETVFNRRRNAMRHNHHRRPRRDEMRRIKQQHDV